ncbi:Glucosaminyl phosphatidylinositol (GlcN-PI) nositol acylation protein [Actinomortierella ambigua]|nr:Glucosaminyl phosphatidylinositol (GlcN-PI) nositol acylation protein [Actinomortierella ambigua]
MGDPTSDAAAYKAAKEAWVTGHTGGSMMEVTIVTASSLTSFILWAYVQKYYALSPSNGIMQAASKRAKRQIRFSVYSFIVDFLTLIVPPLLSITLFADHPYYWAATTLFVAVLIRYLVGPSDDQILKKDRKKFKWRDSDEEMPSSDDEDEDDEKKETAMGSTTATNLDAQDQEGIRQRRSHAAVERDGTSVGIDTSMDPADDGGSSRRDSGSTKPPVQRHKIFLSVYRAGMMLLTCIAILAVDFPVFPRRFSKVEVYGASLMDLGVGSFVFSSGVVSARGYLKKEKLPFTSQMWMAFRTSIPLLVLGFARLIATKGVDYQEHVTEYGMHWNFFFTLGFLPIFVTLFRSLADHVRFSIVGTTLACLYQIFLHYGLEDYIQNAPRVDLISMNKEGIFSFVGYLAIFLMGVDVGLYVLPNDPYFFSKRKISNKKPKKGKLAMILVSLLFLLSMGFLISYGILRIPVSRQMANLSYFFWVITFNTGFILAFLLAEINLTKDEPSAAAIARAEAKASLSTTSDKRQRLQSTVRLPPLSCPPLLEAINRNGLATFLIANVMTGLVNLSIKTLYTPNLQAVAILTIYIFIISAVAWTWQLMGWKLKL